MCCFSRPVENVSATKIFARQLGGGRQALVYAMSVTIAEELAMVLPLPVIAGGGDDAVAFVNLEGYPTFFADLDAAFPVHRPVPGVQAAFARSAPRQALAVHDVGAFVASYVPSSRDFDRLDPRFRMPEGAFAAHAEYADWGFAVFQLKPHVAKPKRRGWWPFGSGDEPARDHAQTLHPMAFTFPSRRPGALFFPTLHLHDGAEVPARAAYDHLLYCQTTDPILARTFAWRVSEAALGESVDAARTRGLVDEAGLAYRRQLVGPLRNVDQWFEPPACAGPHVLAGRGEQFAFDLAATAAYYTELDTAENRAWHATARTRIDELHAGMVAGLVEVTRANATAWQLAAMPADTAHLRALWLSSDEALEFTSQGPTRIAAGAPGPFELSIGARTERVEPQNVKLVFTAAPSPAIIRDIQRAIGEVLERAIPA